MLRGVVRTCRTKVVEWMPSENYTGNHITNWSIQSIHLVTFQCDSVQLIGTGSAAENHGTMKKMLNNSDNSIQNKAPGRGEAKLNVNVA